MCPNCEKPLVAEGRTLVCENLHSHDLAKEGYVNLMPTGKKLAATVGDSAAMFVARRTFFEGGFYEPLRQKLVELVTMVSPRVVGDIGCGEGYYIGGIAAALPEAQCFGTDIAKDGIRMAAKLYPKVSFAVADTYGQLPLAEHRADVLIDVFAPRNALEFNRILDPSGKLIVVIPAPEHLADLRERNGLLGLQPDKLQAVVTSLDGQFKLSDVTSLTYVLDLPAAAVGNLIGMTPNARFQDSDASAYEPITTIAAFEIMSFQRLS